ncbi:MAG: hypothetical protein ACJAYJ_003670 [Saprospiraceae bacterium]|jgi:hypothetical protein
MAFPKQNGEQNLSLKIVGYLIPILKIKALCFVDNLFVEARKTRFPPSFINSILVSVALTYILTQAVIIYY